MKLAAVQLDIAWEQKEKNFRKVEGLAKKAKGHGAELLILPEMFATGFSMKLSLTAEEEDGETSSFLRQLARDTGMAILAGAVFKGRNGLGRNCALAVDKEGQKLATYSKCHVFSFMGEDKYHQPGEGPIFFSLGELTVSPFICYDLRFPELFRPVAADCHLMVVIASWPSARQSHWDILLPARAVENQCYFVGVNRVGTGGGLTFTGGSAVYDPLGNRIAYAGAHETIILAEINPTTVDRVRAEMPFLRDRRF